ncbi:MAG: glycosyltransferase [Acidobacteriota bacterium]
MIPGRPTRVAVGLPVYNGEAYVAQAIESVLAQTHTDFDFLISDNASTDRTGEICRTYAARDTRIRYHRHPHNVGAAPNFDFAFEGTSSKYFAWIAHDDFWAADFLKECSAALDRDQSAVLAFTQVEVIDENGTFVENFHIDHQLGSSKISERVRDAVTLRHRAFAAFGLHRSEILKTIPRLLPFVDSDRAMLARLAARGSFHQVPKRLFHSRIHSERYSSLSSSPRSQIQWFDTSSRPRLIFPNWRLWYEYFRAVQQAPLPLTEKIRSHLQVAFCPARARWFRRRLRFDITRAVRECLGC